MTKTVKSQVVGNYYVTMEVEWPYGNPIYVVRAYPQRGAEYGYPERECIYGMSEETKAKRTYSRYIREYKER